MGLSAVFQVLAAFTFGEIVEHYRAEFPELVDATTSSIAEQFL